MFQHYTVLVAVRISESGAQPVLLCCNAVGTASGMRAQQPMCQTSSHRQHRQTHLDSIQRGRWAQVRRHNGCGQCTRTWAGGLSAPASGAARRKRDIVDAPNSLPDLPLATSALIGLSNPFGVSCDTKDCFTTDHTSLPSHSVLQDWNRSPGWPNFCRIRNNIGRLRA